MSEEEVDSSENTRSKELLLAGMDDRIVYYLKYMSDRLDTRASLINSMIMNRNRVARFLKMPTRDFKDVKKEKEKK